MEFEQLLDNFALIKLNIVTRLNQALNIGGFAGDMLHNNWGKVVKSVDVDLANEMYDPQGQVKQFVITPVEPLKTDYQAGEEFAFQLLLFNHCCSHLPQVLNALVNWQNIGFIPDKRRQNGVLFNIVTIDSIAPLRPVQRIYGYDHWGKLPQPYMLSEALDGVFQNLSQTWADQQPVFGATVSLHTPVRLTFENHQVQQAPTADIWFNAIARRLWLLAKAADLVLDNVDHRDQFYHNLPLQNQPQLINRNSEFVDLKRYSARDRNSQSLGGLLGNFSYQQLDIHHLALLEVGHKLKIGNKTTFGFGCYQWQLMVM